MTANVFRDPSVKASMMSSEYKSATSTIFIPLMQRAGIRKLAVKRLVEASAVKYVPEVEYFCELPAEMKPFSLMIQTPLSEILALFGILRIEIESSKEECDSLKSTYERIVAAVKHVPSTEGSGYDGAKEKEKNDERQEKAGQKAARQVAKVVPKRKACSCGSAKCGLKGKKK